MRSKLLYYCLLTTLLSATGFHTGFTQRSDTLYYNGSWQICEKPFAKYYRFGQIVIDTFWYYKGRIQDFYLSDTLQMDGNYSATGEKDGKFYFFYPDGSLMSTGSYFKNHRVGIWEYYHQKGGLELKIRFPEDRIDFIVLDQIDKNGNVLVKDSTGKFSLRLSTFGSTYTHKVTGEFKNGKRSGDWEFYGINLLDNQEGLVAKEFYNKGKLVKGHKYSPSGAITYTYKEEVYSYLPPDYIKFNATEKFVKDRTTFRNVSDDYDLVDYLVSRKSPDHSDYDMDAKTFEESYVNVLKKLNTFNIVRFFSDPQKIYKGEISFNLSDTGDIEEVEITGNLSETEHERMSFFVKKFKNIKEIMIENVAIDAYHKIYFYSVIFADFMPKRYLKELPEKMFIFSVLPYDKLLDNIKKNGKLKKKKS